MQWPDGQSTVLSQTRWQRTDKGWTSDVTVPRSNGDTVRFATARLEFSDAMRALIDGEGAWIQAKNLLVLRLRARGNDALDLGVIHLG